MITHWGIIGGGKVDEFPPNELGIGLGRVGGNGGSRIPYEFVGGFKGAGCFRPRFGLDGRFLENNNKLLNKQSVFFTYPPNDDWK